MALDPIVIKITADATDVKKTTDILLEQGKVEKKNVKIFETAAKKRQILLAANIKRLQKLKKNRKDAFNPQDIRRFDDLISKTAKDVELLGGKVKKLDKESGFLNKTFNRLGAVVLGAFAVGAIVNFGKKLFATAIESEAFEKRARKVFGNSIEIVEKFAKESAKSLGLTEVGFLGAAAAIGDILVPLGLSRERAAEMSIEAVKLGGALKEFTGDSRSAAEISNIVARSLTGEVETLKTLGVVIDQTSKEFKELVKSKQIDLGLTQQQAKAETIFQLAIDGSKDALESFETNTDSLARQQSILTATLEEQTEHLAELLTPAFIAALKAINSFTKTAQDLAKETIAQNKNFAIQEKEVNTLTSRYSELTSQTDLNADEQEELRGIIEDLAAIVPEAVTEFNRFGVALDINTGKIKDNLEQQKEILRLRSADVIKDIREEIEEFNSQITLNTEVLNKGFVTTTTFTKGGKALIKNVKLTTKEFKNLREENIVLNADIGDLLLSLGELGIELTDVEKEFIGAALGTNRFKDGTEDATETIREQIKNIFFFKNAISELRKEQQEQGTSLQRIAEITRELIPLQEELNKIIGKNSVTAIDLLNKRIGELNKSLINQALAGDIDKDTIEELDKAIDKLAEAEVNLLLATTNTLPALEAQKLALEKVGSAAESTTDLISDFADIQTEEAQTVADARIRALEGVGAAEQTLFDIFEQNTTNRLIILDTAEKENLKNLEKRFNAGILTEEQLAAGQLTIQEESDKKRAEILTKQAKDDKAAALISATINTAIAVTKALATGNIALAALVGILGATEVALIASQPIPTFHEGKKPELKQGEMYAKILKTESVIPTKESKIHKELIDSMIDGNLASYVFKEYQLPLIKQMNKNAPYDDMMFNDGNITRKQGQTNELLAENNRLLKGLQPSLYRQFHGWH